MSRLDVRQPGVVGLAVRHQDRQPDRGELGDPVGLGEHRVGHAAQARLGVAQEAPGVELAGRRGHGLRLGVGHRDLLERLVHQLHAAGVEQRPEVVEQVGAAAGQLRRARAEQGERGEQPGLGEDGGARDQPAEAVPEQVQRLAGLLAEHAGDGDDVGAELGHRVGGRVVRAGRLELPALVEGDDAVAGLGERARAAARSPPCCRCSRRRGGRCRGRPRRRCRARPAARRRRGRCGAPRRGRPAAAGRRARWRGARCCRGRRAGPWSPVNLAPAVRAARGPWPAGSAVAEHLVGQAVDDDGPDAGRDPAGRQVAGCRAGELSARSPGRGGRTRPRPGPAGRRASRRPCRGPARTGRPMAGASHSGVPDARRGRTACRRSGTA